MSEMDPNVKLLELRAQLDEALRIRSMIASAGIKRLIKGDLKVVMENLDDRIHDIQKEINQCMFGMLEKWGRA